MWTTPRRKRPRLEERTPAERAQRGFAKAAAVVVVAVLSYSLFAAVRPMISARLSRTAQAYSGWIEVSFPGDAVIVRDERVVVTPISGAIHFLVENGKRVAAGAVVAEVRDRVAIEPPQSGSLAAQEEIDRFVQECAMREQREKERISALRVQVAIKEAELRAYTDRKDAKNANRLHAELSELHQREASAADSLARIQDETRAAAAAVAEAKRRSDTSSTRALAVLRAFGASLISTHIDGLEGVYSPANPDLLDISPADYTPYPRVCSEGDSVAAGSAVFREVQNLRTNLLVFAEVPEDAAPGAGSRVRVRFPRLATEAVPAAVIGSRRRPDISADTWAFHIALDRYATTLTDLRSESVTLVTERVSGLLIPRSALARKGDDDGVWLLRTNRFIWRSVTVLGMNEEEAAVEGIREGDRVLCRPR
ncbi:MAG TPA: HlyD family efflux transporter periplasmic adaptor subunit [Bacillota bacterium]|nr:HlyD family efflux transporter periplasmic adaptor subunit [Bacillota bacterium]